MTRRPGNGVAGSGTDTAAGTGAGTEAGTEAGPGDAGTAADRHADTAAGRHAGTDADADGGTGGGAGGGAGAGTGAGTDGGTGAGTGGGAAAAVGQGADAGGATAKGGAGRPTPGRPIYLARAGYRSRRLMDAARFLPVAGMFLLIVPMLWQAPDSGIPSTARQAEYLFAVWAALVLVAAVLSRKLSRIMRDADTPEG